MVARIFATLALALGLLTLSPWSSSVGVAKAAQPAATQPAATQPAATQPATSAPPGRPTTLPAANDRGAAITPEMIAYKRSLIQGLIDAKLNALRDRQNDPRRKEDARRRGANDWESKTLAEQLKQLAQQKAEVAKMDEAQVIAAIKRDGVVTRQMVEARRKAMLAASEARVEQQRKANAQTLQDQKDAPLGQRVTAQQLNESLRAAQELATREKLKVSKLTDGQVAMAIIAERQEQQAALLRLQRNGGDGINAPDTGFQRPGSNGPSAAGDGDSHVCSRCNGLGKIGSTATGSMSKIIVGDTGPIRECPACLGRGRVK